MPDSPAIVGVVLAGGDSSRMGRDKALLSLEGRTLLSRSFSLLSTVCDRVVVADRGRGLEPDAESLADGPGHGPAAGILGAAGALPRRALLVLACDLPHVSADLLRRLLREERFDWYLPRHSATVEPLCALFREPALDALRQQVATGELSLQALLLAPLRIGFLEGDELESYGRPSELFFNVNRPADAQQLGDRG